MRAKNGRGKTVENLPSSSPKELGRHPCDKYLRGTVGASAWMASPVYNKVSVIQSATIPMHYMMKNVFPEKLVELLFITSHTFIICNQVFLCLCPSICLCSSLFSPGAACLSVCISPSLCVLPPPPCHTHTHQTEVQFCGHGTLSALVIEN